MDLVGGTYMSLSSPCPDYKYDAEGEPSKDLLYTPISKQSLYTLGYTSAYRPYPILCKSIEAHVLASINL
jgi:hypothetical protein